jgi:hypothetical protein
MDPIPLPLIIGTIKQMKTKEKKILSKMKTEKKNDI